MYTVKYNQNEPLKFHFKKLIDRFFNRVYKSDVFGPFDYAHFFNLPVLNKKC